MSSRIKQKQVQALEQSDTSSSKLLKFLWLIPFIWPFIYLHSFILVINGGYRGIGNDFIDLYYKYKAYLLDNLADFRFPLWCPSEAAGYPFFSNPFAQTFYPLNIPLALYYKLLDGYTALDHQIFTVLGIAIFGAGLFAWLKLINKNVRAVLFAALVMAVSFKVTEIMRFPNAVHTAAWYPWILYGVTRIILNRSIKDAIVSGVLLCFFLICFFTGGYPYYIFYSVFLLVPYFIFFCIRPLRRSILDDRPINWKRAITLLIIAGLTALIICSPYFVSVRHLLDQTADRSGTSYAYSTSYEFSFQDTIGSLIYPPAAQAEGWYFFGIAALLTILLYLFTMPSTAANSIEPGSRSLRIKIFFVLWIAVISYITYQNESYLFNLLWNYMPGFARLRAWGRMDIILVPIFAWLLSIAYNSFEEIIAAKSAALKKNWNKWLPLGALILCYSAILLIQLYLYQNQIYDRYWLLYFKHVVTNGILFIWYGALACAALLLLLTASRFSPLKTSFGKSVALGGLVLLTALETAHVGTQQWTSGIQRPAARTRLNIAKKNELSFSNPRHYTYSTISLNENFNVGIIRNWYFNRYISFLDSTQNEPEERKILLGGVNGQKIFFSQSIEYTSIREYLKDAMRFPQIGRLVSYSGDRLHWEINAQTDGYLSFIDNWDDGWKAFVDDKPAEIKLLFGTFKSVNIPAGSHHVKFSYRPLCFK